MRFKVTLNQTQGEAFLTAAKAYFGGNAKPRCYARRLILTFAKGGLEKELQELLKLTVKVEDKTK